MNARRPRRRSGATSALVATAAATLIMFVAAAAFANVADPLPTTQATSTRNADGTTTVAVQGTWLWSTQTGTASDPCGGTRYGVGWAIGWGDPNAPGNVVSGHGNTVLVGTPTDNRVHFNSSDPCGTLGADNHPTGAWGPETHTYAAGVNVGHVCVVMYDLHDTQAAKPGDYVAGGGGRNKDNSVESGSYDASSTSYCMQPADSGGTELSAGGGSGAVGIGLFAGLILALSLLLWRPRRRRVPVE